MRKEKAWRDARAKALPVGVGRVESYLAALNERVAVAIEIEPCHIPTTGSERLAEGAAGMLDRVPKQFLGEAHHRQYGRPWASGKYIFEFAVSSGLLPQHRLLDFGCGALRFGIWAIPYLDSGNYFGVDSHLESLEAAATYEIPFHDLEDKRPRLLWNDDFTFAHFETSFDWIVDFSSSETISDHDQRELAFARFAEVLRPGGRLLTAPRPNLSPEAFERSHLAVVRDGMRQNFPLLNGHRRFRSTATWSEFVRV